MIDGNIKNLVFDFGGVLVQLNKPRCVSKFAALGFADVEKYIGAYSKEGFFQMFEEGKISTEQFCSEIAKHCDAGVSNEQILDAWCSFLDGVPTCLLNSLIELCKHYRVMLLSNTNKPHWDYSCHEYFNHDNHSLNDYFEKVFLSYEMHVAKPESEIFERVCSEANIVPNETLFLDDSAANCKAAELLGINTYQVTPGEDWRTLFGISLFTN